MRLPVRSRLLLVLLRVLPRHLVSRLAGRAAAVRWPRPLATWVVRAFGRLAGVDFTEVHDPLGSFRSVQDFFVRRLAEGARPIDPASDAVVAPCDGAWGQAGRVEDGTLLQVKGRPYALAELLGSADDARRFEGGVYATFYLSPRDYHRFHMPCAGRVARARHLPGGLWPVNRAGVEGVDSLFARNERLVAFFDVDDAGAGATSPLAIAAVGATMVGKVKVVFDDLETNLPGASVDERTYEPPPELAKGEEWGRFEFGSTLVLVASRGLLGLDLQPPGTPLRLGRRIGTLSGATGASDPGKT